ncbi:chemotaxis-specific protein-glutamate methyltransferase CheB [Halanaerobacter jeridensis]|uniref:Protein-glutamate methylesterase/protein-glutamine glutaminase n=1 Tax=Halanaerobacter jeridensis TaxID=706427 RepID=A0A938XNW8_9FIRM|nr:two-component system chemotaxis response regulator CheB [Halanaerobacter jeridensis]
MDDKTEILVVDDSAFMRKVITELLETNNKFKVVDTARNGVDALKKIEKYTPDVITLDVEMPKMNGLDFLKRLMAKKPIPVVMLSSVTAEGSEETIKALERGAFDFITKPSGSISLDIDKVKDELLKKVKLAAQSGVQEKINRQVRRKSSRTTKRSLSKEVESAQKSSSLKFNGSKTNLLVIGASTGGPKAIKEVMSSLPGNLQIAILIVQHMPAGFTKSLAKRLNKLSDYRVKEAEEGDKVKVGTALLAPGDYHMLIKNGKVKLSQGVKVHNVRPAIDKTIGSVVKDYKNSIVGVLLTGMGKDGAKGMKLIKEFGGKTIAQDEKTSVVYGMPKVAYKMGAVDKVSPVYDIPKEIAKLFK